MIKNLFKIFKRTDTKEVKKVPKVSVIKSLIDNPDDFKYTLWFENGEMNLKVVKNENCVKKTYTNMR